MSWLTRRRAMMSCRQVHRVLQSYLDGQLDEVTAKRVERHLEACRRCGLEASTYTEIKTALARRRGLDPAAVERLTDFARRLPREAGERSGPPDQAAGNAEP